MVHTFEFKYRDRVHYFAWDVESGSLHNLDYVAFLIARQVYTSQPLTVEQEGVLSDIDKSEYDDVLGELEALKEEGCFDSPCTTAVECKGTGIIKALCLNVCYDCNLRCKYCFADEGTYRTDAKAHMTPEVGKAAVDFLIAHSGNRTNLEIDFFGGEPLLCLDTVKQVVEYARSREENSGKKFSFTMTTNCLLLDKKTAEWLNDNMYNVVLSIDGRRQVHNAMRPTCSGADVYDLILSNALYMAELRGDKSYYVRGTFTPANLDFTQDVKAMHEAGFNEISLEPVVSDIDGIAITGEHLPAIYEEYGLLAQYYLDCYNEGKPFNFFHFNVDLTSSPCMPKRLTGCGSGCEYAVVNPDGKLYPCHQFSEMEEYCMGDVFSKDYNMDISAHFARNIVTQKPDCADCMAKYYCSGGCAANNIKYTGDMNKPYAITCEMMRRRLELALGIEAYKLASSCDTEDGGEE